MRLLNREESYSAMAFIGIKLVQYGIFKYVMVLDMNNRESFLFFGVNVIAGRRKVPIKTL